VTAPDESLLKFAASSFSSVWALELLLVLKGQPRPWPRAELVTTLRASELVVTRALESLLAAGLVSIDGDEAAYMPVNDKVAAKVDALEKLYAARPNSVRRAIVASSSGGATAFADAFKFRKD
jgi:DNA-binding IclR family transcriptional regulator